MSEAALVEMRDYVAAVVAPHRAHGLKAAWAAAADRLGISPRRVRAFLNREARSVKAAEYIRAREAYAALLLERVTALRAELAEIEEIAGGMHGLDMDRGRGRPAAAPCPAGSAV